MPTNVSPEYKKAEERYRDAKTPEERLVCLEEMLSTIPKHKGTEKVCADIKSRISKAKKEMTSSKKGAKRQDWFHVEKQGAGQVALFGAPNAGKSALVNHLTGLPTQVAAYPFTTTMPAGGMMTFEGVQIQLVDTPPLAPDTPPWVYHIIRTATLGLWVLDLSDDDILSETEQVEQSLTGARLSTEPSEELRHVKTLRVGAKCDDPEARDRLEILREMIGDVEVHLVSIESGEGIEELKRTIFLALDIIRVYTKKPSKPADMSDPVVVPVGSTVMDAAYHLHKDFAKNLNFARLWNETDHDGQRVERAHVLQDRDVLEFHT